MLLNKLLRLILFTLVVMDVHAAVPPLTTLTLAWDKSASNMTNISYVLKWGASPGATNFSMSVGTNLTATVTNLIPGVLYFHVVSRITGGIESVPGNTVSITNYPPAPLKLRITANSSFGIRLEGTTDGILWFHLAQITNGPAFLAARQRMMLRTPTNPPPFPTIPQAR